MLVLKFIHNHVLTWQKFRTSWKWKERISWTRRMSMQKSNCICDSVIRISNIAFIWSDIVVVSNKIVVYEVLSSSFSSFPILRRSWNWEVIYFWSFNMWGGWFKFITSVYVYTPVEPYRQGRIYFQWYKIVFGNFFYLERNFLSELIHLLMRFNWLILEKVSRIWQANLLVLLVHSPAKLDFVLNGRCTVCLADYHSEDLLRILPYCGHSFHVNCIDIWLHQHSTCPVCRLSLREVQDKKRTMQPLFSSAIRALNSDPCRGFPLRDLENNGLEQPIQENHYTTGTNGAADPIENASPFIEGNQNSKGCRNKNVESPSNAWASLIGHWTWSYRTVS